MAEPNSFEHFYQWLMSLEDDPINMFDIENCILCRYARHLFPDEKGRITAGNCYYSIACTRPTFGQCEENVEEDYYVEGMADLYRRSCDVFTIGELQEIAKKYRNDRVRREDILS